MKDSVSFPRQYQMEDSGICYNLLQGKGKIQLISFDCDNFHGLTPLNLFMTRQNTFMNIFILMKCYFIKIISQIFDGYVYCRHTETYYGNSNKELKPVE